GLRCCANVCIPDNQPCSPAGPDAGHDGSAGDALADGAQTTLQILPANPCVPSGSSLQLTANMPVSWIVVGGFPELGTITPSGLYTAPARRAGTRGQNPVRAFTAPPLRVAEVTVGITTPPRRFEVIAGRASGAGYSDGIGGSALFAFPEGMVFDPSAATLFV